MKNTTRSPFVENQKTKRQWKLRKVSESSHCNIRAYTMCTTRINIYYTYYILYICNIRICIVTLGTLCGIVQNDTIKNETIGTRRTPRCCRLVLELCRIYVANPTAKLFNVFNNIRGYIIETNFDLRNIHGPRLAKLKNLHHVSYINMSYIVYTLICIYILYGAKTIIIISKSLLRLVTINTDTLIKRV